MGIEYHEDLFTEEFKDFRGREQDLFMWFTVFGRCSKCLRLIIEPGALDRAQKIFACQIAQQAGVDLIKTSTGMHPAGGATVGDIRLMKETAPACKIKAAGGIKTAKQAIEMLEAGAARIGTSSGVRIMEQLKAGQLQ